jgi:hypothetical protein
LTDQVGSGSLPPSAVGTLELARNNVVRPAPTAGRAAAPAAVLQPTAAAQSTAPAASASGATEPLWRGRLQTAQSLVTSPDDATELAALRAGALVLVLERQDAASGHAWLRVRQPGGPEGWLPAESVVEWTAPHPQTAARRPGGAGTVVPSAPGEQLLGDQSVVRDPSGQGVRLRDAPDGAAGSATIPNGALVAVLEYAVDAEGHAWARIQSGDALGWAPVSVLAPPVR